MTILRNPTTGLVALFVLAGCQGNPSGSGSTPPTQPEAAHEHADHPHERGKMLIADVGKYHALLTAHLSQKDGHELDVFFETADPKDPKPVALPLEQFTAQATTGGGEPKELVFESAPAAERPKDEKPGTCSHFVAKAPWLKLGEKYYVVAKLTIDGRPVTARWKDFDPKKYAHHED